MTIIKPKESIIATLLKRVIAWYFMVVLIVSLSLMVIQESRLSQTYNNNIIQLYKSFEPSLSTALWSLDNLALDVIEKGLLSSPTTGFIELYDGQQQRITQFQRPEHSLLTQFMSTPPINTFELYYPQINNEETYVGRISIGYSRQAMAESLWKSFFNIIAYTAITALCLSLGFIWLVQRLLTDPLKKMAAEIAMVDLDSDSGFKFEQVKRHGEIAIVATTLDTLFHRAYTSKNELALLNENLEKQVIDRTEKMSSLMKDLERLATTDPLTGISNRRHFMEVIEHEEQRILRNRIEPAMLLLLDIDHFKKFNDQHGHYVGDQVLKAVSKTILQALRKVDTFARFGGEEFIILMPSTSQEAALLAAERIRSAIETLSLTHSHSLVNPTISIGISRLRDQGVERCIQQADDALYSAKEMGRNRVICSEDITELET